MTASAPSASADQPLVGFMSNAEWDALLGEVNGLIEQMDAWPDAASRQQVFRLLDGIDAIRREALRRLVRVFKEGVLDKVVTDPAIHTLMELYDLLPESAAQPQAETVIAGNEAPKSRFATIPIRAVAARPPSPPRFPHWLPVLDRLAELPAGTARELPADGEPILLCRRGDELFALDARCARDGIGGMSIVQELMQGYDAVLVIDAHQRGSSAGSLCLLEPVLPDLSALDAHALRDYFADTHYATPLRALALARHLGRLPACVRVIGCEPLSVESMSLGLSAPVAAAVEPAVTMALEWLRALRDGHAGAFAPAAVAARGAMEAGR